MQEMIQKLFSKNTEIAQLMGLFQINCAKITLWTKSEGVEESDDQESGDWAL